MPAKSKRQLRAMHAAASGKSTLGIPKKVGCEYVKATHKMKGMPERAKKRKPARRKK